MGVSVAAHVHAFFTKLGPLSTKLVGFNCKPRIMYADEVDRKDEVVEIDERYRRSRNGPSVVGFQAGEAVLRWERLPHCLALPI